MSELLTRIGQFATAQAQRVKTAITPRLMQGAGIFARVPDMLADRGIDTVLVVTTEGFVRRGTIDSLVLKLRERGVVPIVFSDVDPDPDIECIVRAADKYRHNSCQAIVAIGGGSAIDCAKVVGALAVNPKRDIRSLMGTMHVRAKTPFLVAVPTTAGTGSEVTADAVVTDTERKRKYTISDLALVPDVAVLDPELLVGLPPAMTAYTGMDALAHAVEAYTARPLRAVTPNRRLHWFSSISRIPTTMVPTSSIASKCCSPRTMRALRSPMPGRVTSMRSLMGWAVVTTSNMGWRAPCCCRS